MSRISRTGRSVLSGGERTFPTLFRCTEIEYRRYRIWRFFPGGRVPGRRGGELWVHLVSDAGQAAAYFSAAYQHRKIDFTGFEKEEL